MTKDMKTMTFGCYANAGKCDTTDWEMDFDITPEEEQLVIRNIKAGNDNFADIPELADLYNRVYDQMLDEQISVYRDLGEDGELQDIADENELDDIDDVTDEMIRDYLEEMYIYGIVFPPYLIEMHQKQ